MSLNFRPKYDKIVELLLYLAHIKPGTDKYQAVKFFYLADKEHLNRHGRPITFETYFALPYGPVASKTKELLEGDERILRAAKIKRLPFRIERVTRPGKEDLLKITDPLREVDFDLFSRSDIAVFDEIIDMYGDYTFDELYNLTHEHPAYQKAWQGRPQGAKSAPMLYEEMIDSKERRAEIVEDIGPVASRL